MLPPESNSPGVMLSSEHSLMFNAIRSVTTAAKRVLPVWITDGIVLVRLYRQNHHRLPNVIWPKRFTEKVLHRMIFDRRLVLTEFVDKAAARQYCEARLGSKMLPKLYCLTDRPESIPFDDLPEKFVVKPTHASACVRIVSDKKLLDQAEIVETCKGWLKRNYYDTMREWAYKHVAPLIIVEEFIDGGNGSVPNDYKFFVFGGVVEFIQVDADRFTRHRRSLYTRAWKKLPVRLQFDDIEGEVPCPIHLGEMIGAAEALGKDLDFVRVDFYDTPKGPYFGELTGTPAASTEVFRPASFDRYLGGLWRLPRVKVLRLFQD
jgi:TupA-like ATPgrasp